MIEWDETDVLTVLEVSPETECDEECWHRYVVSKDSLRLELTIFSWTNEVRILLFCDGIAKPIFSTMLSDCFCIRRAVDKLGERLQIVAPCPSGNGVGDSWIEIHIAIHPHISVKLCD